MTTPYLAPSLAVLRAEINQRWPNRDHTSDGWIGDAAHQATRSDHNPNARGSVDALDVDDDGIDFATVFAAIKRHPSARYVIYERTLYHRLRGWKPEPYSGPSPHTEHFHLSIDQTREAEQDTRPWGLLEDDMATVEEIWGAQNAEYVDENGNKVRDQRTRADILYAAHAAAVRAERDIEALTAKVDALASRPPAAVDYDKLADAIVRRVITPPAS